MEKSEKSAPWSKVKKPWRVELQNLLEEKIYLEIRTFCYQELRFALEISYCCPVNMCKGL